MLVLILILAATAAATFKIETMLVMNVPENLPSITIAYDAYNKSDKALKMLSKIPQNTYLTDIMNIKPGDKLLCVTNDEKAFLLIRAKGNMASKRIGCPTPTHRTLFELVAGNNYEFVQTNSLENVDILVFFQSLHEPKQYPGTIDILDYPIMNLPPFCKIRKTALDVFFKPYYYDRNPIKTYASFDIIVAGRELSRCPFNTQPEKNFLQRYIK